VILEGLPERTCHRVIEPLERGDELGWCPQCRKVGSDLPGVRRADAGAVSA
jgi:hypothetical protein